MTTLRDLVPLARPSGSRLPAWLDRLVAVGIVSQDPGVVRRQKVANVVSFIAAINAVARVISYFFFEFEAFWFACAFGTGLTVWALLINRLHRFGDNAAAMALIAWYLTGILFTTFMFGTQTQAHAFFVLAGVMLFLFGVERWRLFLFWLAVVFVEMMVVLNYAPERGAVPDPALLHSMGVQSMVTAVTINAVVIFYALYLLRRTELDLDRERARAEALVSVVLPESIAARLRSGKETSIADRIENVTILFADLTGFTEAAHAQPPEVVVRYLDELVQSFDAMCAAHGVAKIKIVGDAYMAAGGLEGDPCAGAIATGRLALAMLRFQAERPPLGDRRLTLRVGIHTGPAVAGVIGDTRISYDLWGDAVNVASRMESHGVPGRIQVSEAYRRMVGEAFAFELRGATQIKGLGAPRTFFLVAEEVGAELRARARA
jgi:adenylate cyclase